MGALAKFLWPLLPHVDRPGPWAGWRNGRTHCSAKQWLFRCEVNYTAESLRIHAARGRAEMQDYYKTGKFQNLHIGGDIKGTCMDLNHFPSMVGMTSLSPFQPNSLPFPCCVFSGEHLPLSKTLFLITQLPVASFSVKQGPGVIWVIGLNRNMHIPKRQSSFSL